MSELISGKEALIDLANGGEVEYLNNFNQLDSATCAIPTMDILDDKYKFRLKPRTIMINGVEVPTPSKPKIGDTYWTIDGEGEIFDCVWDDDGTDIARLNFMGVYKTKEDAEKVYDTVRGIFK